MKMNSIMAIYIAAAWFGMLLAPVAMAQQADNAAYLEQLAGKLRAASVASAAAKKQVTTQKRQAVTSKKQKVPAKKQKVVAMKQMVAVNQETVAKQQKAEVIQVAAVEAAPDNKIANVRAEARAIARAAAQAQAAIQDQMATSSVIVKSIPFNRTMRLPDTYNLPPAQDGFHDPANEGINALHAPQEAFADLPRRHTGNRVDWVAALNEKKITPRWDRTDAQAEGMVMDMDIVRVPKGSMPNVVFPHKQHTEWLACSNCHPAIFVPQKGANEISMRLILNGEKCGVCHGKVAFPPSECRLCHSQKKDLPQDMAGAP